jgi:hypothetical protein
MVLVNEYDKRNIFMTTAIIPLTASPNAAAVYGYAASETIQRPHPLIAAKL